METLVKKSRSIAEFCKRNSISRAYFYKLKNQGKGPRMMATNRISDEAEVDWCRMMEAEPRSQRIPCRRRAEAEAA
jgi:hypothetical protein